MIEFSRLFGAKSIPISIRVWLAVIGLVGLLSALGVGILTGWYSWSQHKLKVGENLIAMSRALIQATTQELDHASILLTAISRLPEFRSANWSNFKSFFEDYQNFYEYFLIVSDFESHRIVMRTKNAPGELPDEWRNYILSERTQISSLIDVESTGQWATAIQLVVQNDSGVSFVFTLGIPASRFQRIISDQKHPPTWSPVILDRNWIIVARSPYQYIGKRGANYHLKDVPAEDIIYDGKVLEGFQTFHARSRSDRYEWTAAVAVPQKLLVTESIAAAIVATSLGTGICLITALTMLSLSIRLKNDVDTLSQLTRNITGTENQRDQKFRFRELSAIAEVLDRIKRELKSEEEFRKRVVDELAHRLRNKTATIQAIVHAQLQDYPELYQNILGRLSSLAATDDLIMRAQGKGAELGEIVKFELAPYDGSTWAGPSILLEPKRAMIAALVLHELATNACKYGALSLPQGRVEIRWSVAANVLRLRWQEVDGPPVTEPFRRGFGTRLVYGLLSSIGGAVEPQFLPTGLVLDIHFKLTDPGATLQPGSAAEQDRNPDIL